MLRNELVKTIILFLLIIGTTVGSSVALNLATGPKIEADRIEREEAAAQQAAGVLLEVFPGAKGFEEITSELKIDAASGVSAVHKETSGLGYVFVASKTNAPMKDLVTVTVGVDNEGKVTGIAVSFANENDYPVKENTLNSFVGQDSTLTGVEVSTGATVSSNTIKEAVAAGFLVLAANDLMKAAAKELEQVFEEELVKLLPGFVKGDNLSAKGNIYTAYKSKNNSVVVAYVAKGESKLLTVTGMNLAVKVYEAVLVDEATQQYTLNDVTSNHDDVVAEVTEYATPELKTTLSAINRKIKSVFGAEQELTELTINNVGLITAAVTFEVEGVTYYAYQVKPVNGYAYDAMNVYVIFDAEGKIYSFSAATYFYGSVEHFGPAKEFDKTNYEELFNNMTSDSYDENDVLIAGATFTTNALKQAIEAAFAEFDTLGGNN